MAGEFSTPPPGGRRRAVSRRRPAALVEIRRLDRGLKRRAVDVLAFFDRAGRSNGPTEAINKRHDV
jgi:transposase